MEKEIGKITKRDDTDIVLRIDDFADKRGFTIREFVTSERYTGFTKSGVRILAKDWLKFKEMINSVDDADMVDPNADSQAAIQEEAMAAAQAEAQAAPEEPKAEEPSRQEDESSTSTQNKSVSKEELPDY